MTDQYWQDSEAIAVAYHEAGHAVAAHELGLYVNAIEIKDGAGRVLIDGIEDKDRRSAVMYMAGLAAHDHYERHGRRPAVTRAKLNGTPPPAVMAVWPELSTEDAAGINRYLRANYIGGATADHDRADLLAEARALVKEQSPAINRIVEGLMSGATATAGGWQMSMSRSVFLDAMSATAEMA